MSFFEPPPPPPPPEPPEHELQMKPWWHAPRDELGVSTSLRFVLARTDNVAVAVLDAIAYSTGIEFVLAVIRRTSSRRELFADPFDHPFGHFARPLRMSEPLPPELLRFGIQFSDGRKATTLGSPLAMGYMGNGEEEPEGPFLSPGSGGGGDDRWDSSFWLWPLPPPGPVAFVVEWPSEGIELTREEVDADILLEAGARSEALWP